MTGTPGTTMEQCVLFLYKKIAQGLWKHGDQLPPYRHLAKMAHTTPRLMLNALAQLQQDKVLISRPGSGFFIGDQLPSIKKRQAVVKTNAVEAAVQFLRALIEKKGWDEHGRLPPYRKLASDAGVSGPTMLAAIAQLKNEDILCSGPKKGVYVKTALAMIKKIDQPKAAKISPIDHIKTALKNDIVDSLFQDSDYLPAFKELALRYRTGYITIQKVIEDLVKEEILIPDKRRYRIRTFTISVARNKIWLVLADNILNGGMWRFERSRIDELLSALESECARKNLLLIKCKFSPDLYRSINPADTFGVVFWQSWWLQEDIFKLVTLIPQRIPVTVFTVPGLYAPEIYSQLQEFGVKRKNFYYADLDIDTKAGFSLGRFLYGKGYRSILFFAEKENQWATDRLTGLTKAFETLNVYNAIQHISPIPLPNDPDSKEHITLITDQLNLVEKVRQDMIAIGWYPQSIKIGLDAQLSEYCQSDLKMRTIYPALFDQVFSTSKNCVWVCGDDNIALAALEFIEKHNFIKHTIGIAGFGDHEESSRNNLTTWHFDYAQAARRVITLMLYPDMAKQFGINSKPGMFVMDGMVIDRGSV